MEYQIRFNLLRNGKDEILIESSMKPEEAVAYFAGFRWTGERTAEQTVQDVMALPEGSSGGVRVSLRVRTPDPPCPPAQEWNAKHRMCDDTAAAKKCSESLQDCGD